MSKAENSSDSNFEKLIELWVRQGLKTNGQYQQEKLNL